MNRHLTWDEVDAWIHGRLEDAAPHLAECRECAERIRSFRAEDDAIRGVLAVGEADESEVDALLQKLDAPRRASWSGVLPLLAASMLVGLLILVLTSIRSQRSADPIADAIQSGDSRELARYGRKAAPHVPSTQAAELRSAPIRVLYVEGESRNEYRMLRPALLKDRGLLVHTMLLNSSDADLYGKSEAASDAPPRFRDIAKIFPLSDEDLVDYDVIILGEVEAARLSSSPDVVTAALASFVKRLGGTLIVVAGPRSSPTDVAHAAADLLPTELAGSAPVTTEVVVPGRSGATLRWHLRTTLRRGCAALESAGDDPIVAAGEAGRGRVTFVASDDFWSWGPERQYAFYRGLIAR